MQAVGIIVKAAHIRAHAAITRLQKSGKGMMFGKIPARMGRNDNHLRIWIVIGPPEGAAHPCLVRRIERHGNAGYPFNRITETDLRSMPVCFGK